MRLLALLTVTAVAASCVRNAPLKLSSGGKLVRVAKGDPPPGARELGPIVGEDGDECGGLDAVSGTYTRALIRVRNRAAARGGNYVEIMTLTEPHQETRYSYDCRYVIRGMLYDVPAPSASEPGESASDSSACDPPCSPGFTCDEGACEPVCNPECSAGQVCRADRTCGPPS